MTLVAVSKDTIRANVIRYFHDVFHDPVSSFKGSTNVRQAYKYKPEAWRRLGIILSRLSWMRALNVILEPDDMVPCKTIDDLTNAIWGKLNKVISVSAARARLGAATIQTLSAPKPIKAKAGRRAPKRAGKSRREKAAAKRPKKPKR